jgi:hypothetical protein
MEMFFFSKPPFNLLRCQQEFSMKVYGPGARAGEANLIKIRASARELGSAHPSPGDTVRRYWNVFLE